MSFYKNKFSNNLIVKVSGASIFEVFESTFSFAKDNPIKKAY